MTYNAPLNLSLISLLSLLSLLVAPALACTGDGATTGSSDSESGASSDASASSGASVTSEGDASTGGLEECASLPDGSFTLTLIDNTNGSGCRLGTQGSNELEGVFELTETGFRVTGLDDDIEIGPVQPEIPDGTFVRLQYGCDTGWHSGSGAWAMLENLDSWDGEPNPTESGGRLWYWVVAGGEAYNYPKSPFALEMHDVCQFGDPDDIVWRPQELVVTGASFETTVALETTVTLVETEGPHAGTYEFENRNVTLSTEYSGAAGQEVNLRMVRSD